MQKDHNNQPRKDLAIWYNNDWDVALHLEFTNVNGVSGAKVFKDALNDGNGMVVLNTLSKHHKCWYYGDRIYRVTLMHLAVEHYQMKVLMQLVNLGFDVDVVDDNEMSPLHYAVVLERAEMVEYLLKHGASPNKPMDRFNHVTPYQYACKAEDSDILKSFLTRGCNANEIGDWTYDQRAMRNSSPLHAAVVHNNYEATELLIQYGACVNAKNDDGETPLDVAIYRGHLDIVKLLFEHKSILNQSKLLLHKTAKNGDFEMSKQLLDHGWDIKCVDSKDWTALMVAVVNRSRDTVDIMLDYNSDTDCRYNKMAFCLAVLIDGLPGRMYELFVRHGFEFDDKLAVDSAFLAIDYGFFDMIEVLLNKGYPLLSARNEDGDMLIHYAFKKNQLEIARLLATRGANVMEVDSKGNNAVFLAALSAEEGIVKITASKAYPTLLHEVFKDRKSEVLKRWKLLLKHGVSSNGRDPNDDGVTPLILVCRDVQIKYSQPLIDLLLEYDANPHLAAYDGTTVLHLMARTNDYVETVQRLLKTDMNINAKNSKKMTPLHIAVVSGSDKVVRELINEGANINASDDSEATPMNLAISLLGRRMPSICFRKAVEANRQLLTQHLEKLRAAKMYICESNRWYINNILDNKRKEFRRMCEEEVEYMRKLKLSSSASVYTYLRKIVNVSKKEPEYMHIDMEEYIEEFPIYSNLLLLAKKVSMRQYAKVRGCDALCLVISKDLPYHCALKVLQHLSVTDVTNLLTAANIEEFRFFKNWYKKLEHKKDENREKLIE